jgi:integrase
MSKSKHVDPHHLEMHGGTWWIRYKMPESLGGKRIRYPTGTSDLSIAANIRDRILNPIIGEAGVSEVGRRVIAAVKQSDDSGRALVALANEELDRSTPTGPTLREAAARFILNRRNFKNNSSYTMDDYQRTLTYFEKIIGNMQVESIAQKHVRAYRDQLLLVGTRWCRGADLDLSTAEPEDRLTMRTVAKQIKNLSTFFNWANQEELVIGNPANIQIPDVLENKAIPPPNDMADPLCQMPWPDAPTIGIMEWTEMPWFYRYTGARCGEIGQLRLMDVKTVDGILVLDTFTLKTSKRRNQDPVLRRRLVPVSEKLKPHLANVLQSRSGANPDEYLFPLSGHRLVASVTSTPFTRHAWGFSNLYNRHAKKISEIHLHCWRAYAISQMARGGFPPEVRARVVGHSLTGVHDGYTHFNVASLKAAVDSIA